MKTFYCLIALISLYFLVSINALSQYNSTFEKDILTKLGDAESIDAYDLLNAINYNEQLYKKGKHEIESHIAVLKAKNLQQKPLKKQIQTIYKTTHTKFFKKYESKVNFNNIFQNGEYNCVTASALYAIIFDAFKINYSIRETPTHVYLIADTLGLQTLIESTMPGKGVIIFNEKFKKDYVNYLSTNKIISESEFSMTSTDELFQKYYSQDKSINLKQLSALQYYNKGVYLMEEEKFTGAASFLQKARSIYPSNNIQYNHYAALQNALVQDYNKKQYDGKLFGQLVQFCDVDSSLTRLVSDYFENVSVELCVKSPDLKRYTRFYNDMSMDSSDANLPDDLKYKYHYYRAYYYGATGDYPTSLYELKMSYSTNEENLLVQELAKDIVSKYLLLDGRHKKRIDSLEYYFNELPFLIENNVVQQRYVYFYMRVIGDSYMYEEPEIGYAYYKRFLEATEKYELKDYSEEHISFGFGLMAYYYAEEGDFSRAKKIVNNGLRFSPESLRLKQVMDEIAHAMEMEKNYKNYNNRANTEEVVYLNNNQSPESLKEKVDKNFPGNWKAVSIIMEDMEQALNQKEIFELKAEKNKSCIYIHNGKTEKGKWAYRPKSRCIYFVPDADKDDYKVFKVKEIDSDKLVLLPYKDQRNPSPYRYVLKHTN